MKKIVRFASLCAFNKATSLEVINVPMDGLFTVPSDWICREKPLGRRYDNRFLVKVKGIDNSRGLDYRSVVLGTLQLSIMMTTKKEGKADEQD